VALPGRKGRKKKEGRKPAITFLCTTLVELEQGKKKKKEKKEVRGRGQNEKKAAVDPFVSGRAMLLYRLLRKRRRKRKKGSRPARNRKKGRKRL